MKSVAFKVTYNDGGAGSGTFGYRDTCSNRNILENVTVRRASWCSSEDHPCRVFAESNFQGRRPKRGQCYESALFSNSTLRFGGGFYHGETKTGPIPLKGTTVGDIAFLTTLLPGCDQAERIIFACFRVGTVDENGEMGHTVESDGSMDVLFPDHVARQMSFWRYFENSDGSQLWGAGLFRYIDQKQTNQAISDLLLLLGDHSSRDILLRALDGKVVPEAVRRVPLLDSTPGIGGFGGGERREHRELKEYVASNPLSVGLPENSSATVEFPFLSGDQVDIKFDLPDGSAAIVEIETINPFPGAHQCIKYRALLESALGYELGSGKVRAILVAHRFDNKTRAFASAYGIELVELRLEQAAR